MSVTRQGRPLRIFYAIGPGDVVKSFGCWRDGKEMLAETSQTYSSQFFEFCRRHGHVGYALSSFHGAARADGGKITAENRPKSPGGAGIRYHLAELRYGLSVVRSALRFRADAVIVDSGTSHWFVFSALKPFGVRVVGSLHNTVWPSGFPPRRLVQRLVLWTDGLFWRRFADGLLAVSPECERQVRQLAKRFDAPAEQYRAHYRIEDFANVPPAPPARQRPLRVLFAGRVERNKGVLDIVEMARQLERAGPGRVTFDICGTGQTDDALGAAVRDAGLEAVVRIRGRLNRPDLLAAYGASHLVIVPTRSDFIEGFAMVCAEAMLCGRPVVTSPVVPAAEVLADATLVARTDDPESYVQAIERVLADPALYERLAAACAGLARPFVDPGQSLAAALDRLFARMRW